MRSVSRHRGIEVLDEAECRNRLGRDVVGRVAVVIGATPMIFPVNYLFDGDAIVRRTLPGSRLDVGQGHAAFEVDGFDRATRSGWSVLVTGRLEALTRHQTKDMACAGALPLVPWPQGDRSLWLRLRPSFITGRVVRDTGIGHTP